MKLEKIGVIAGVFDPIHAGHLKFIKDSIDNYELGKIFILIEEDSKFKKSQANFDQRKKIIELSIAEDSRVSVYPSATKNFPISSTLPILKTRYKAQFYLLVGNDVKDHINKWENSEEILSGVELIIADRTEDSEHKKISSGKVKQQIKSGSQQVDMAKSALDYCIENKLYI